MSKSFVERVKCPSCGAEHEVTIWQSINTQMHPEMKEKVLTDEAFLVTCPQCGGKGLMDYDFLYHQMEDGVMIQYAAKDHVAQYEKTMDQVKMLGSKEGAYPGTLRIVSTREDLKDKILTFSAGYDDRVMEIYKTIIREYIIAEGSYPSKPEKVYLNIDQNGEKAFIVFMEDGEILKADFDENAYEVVKKEMEPLFADDQSYVIDEAWAKAINEEKN